jgi:ADP-heptose:LPS heptosyltransferase
MTTAGEGSLQIADTAERRLVRVADALLGPFRWLRRRSPKGEPRRVLLLRLERIGDLLMVLDAIYDARAAWPSAEIDLAVGRWNASLAALIPGLSHVHVASVPWLARGERAESWLALVVAARRWRARRYDLIVNFEPDIRSNVLAWIGGAPRRIGYSSGGGAALLTDAYAFARDVHTSANARELIARAAGSPRQGTGEAALLTVPDRARQDARARLQDCPRPVVAVHVAGGRPSKQWHLSRFAAVARHLAESHGATIVLTGTPADRPFIDEVRNHLHGLTVLDLGGAVDLVGLAGLLAETDLVITGDTGPMHLAAAVGTPVVALFGPSNPARYGPSGARTRVLRVDLPCSPCGQVRLPPERCRGHVPDCLDAIQVGRVVEAARGLLNRAAPQTARPST